MAAEQRPQGGEGNNGEKKQSGKNVLVISIFFILLLLFIIVSTAVRFGRDLSHIAQSGAAAEQYRADFVWAIVMMAASAAALVMLIIYSVKVVRPLLMIEDTIFNSADEDRPKAYKQPQKIKPGNAFFRLYEQLNTMIEKNRSMAVREYSLQMLRKQAELAALQSQINPHFLYNTLDCIRGIAIDQGANSIEEMTKALSDMFRYSVSRKQMQVRLHDELANVMNYLTIQQYRFNNRLNICVDVEPDTYDCIVPKLLIQPIVENAVFYGLEPKIGQKDLYIRAYRTKKRLVINVEDNGVGMATSRLSMMNDALSTRTVLKTEGKSTKIGLTNVNERIKLLYGQEYGIRAFSCQNVGTNIEVALPAQTEETIPPD